MIDLVLFSLSDDQRLNVHVQQNRPWLPRIEGAENDDDIMRQITAQTGIDKNDILHMRHGIDYMSGDGMVSSRFVQLRQSGKDQGLSENFSIRSIGTGNLHSVDAQDLLRSSRSGMTHDAALELNMYHLMLECDIQPAMWSGPKIAPENHYVAMGTTLSSLDKVLRKTFPRNHTPMPFGATIMPVIFDERSSMVMVGLKIGDTESGQCLTLPRYAVPPHAPYGSAKAQRSLANKAEIPKPSLIPLGHAYIGLGHHPASCSYSYIATEPSMNMLRSCHFVTLRDAFFSGHFLRDPDLMIPVMRLTHRLGLWPEFTQTCKPGYAPKVSL